MDVFGEFLDALGPRINAVDSLVKDVDHANSHKLSFTLGLLLII
jgi:hypothetical protein